MERQLSEAEKKIVQQQQRDASGALRCFLSGEIITEQDPIEYDHLHPFSKDGSTDISNIRVVLTKYHKKKGDRSLYDVRDNLRLERLFEAKKNNIKLQDIFSLKDIHTKSLHFTKSERTIALEDGATNREFSLFHDDILDADYFYGRIPIAWLENDDQEGLQPRVIDYKRLISIRDHLRNHPQLAPSIGRLLKGRLKLFDGQHKLAAQALNNQPEVDVKVYVSSGDDSRAKKLFDDLMITNLEAHSKLKQVPFYTSTLFDRLSVIYKDFLDEFISTKPAENHTEENFLRFIALEKRYSKSDAKEILRSAIKSAALEGSVLNQYVAAASKDASYPITIDLLDRTIFPSTLYLNPSNAKFSSDADYRNSESDNFAKISGLLVQEGHLQDWVQNVKGRTLTGAQLKARRIWHKGSVLTWAPYLKSILFFALQIMTNEERERVLHRPAISDQQLTIVKTCLGRLFSDPMWDEPEGEIDSLLVSARRQDELFARKGLTERYVIYGER